ncbi:unnamed protein product [Paramecium octaurelia]|uniref:Uncharacterized protein n=1 Tax=Paramecium octaurelia TaxID=43137 RepID=A0A8S1SWV3_PAROT|nr:unnamed protein product [Paramecium octaurelia]
MCIDKEAYILIDIYDRNIKHIKQFGTTQFGLISQQLKNIISHFKILGLVGIKMILIYQIDCIALNNKSYTFYVVVIIPYMRFSIPHVIIIEYEPQNSRKKGTMHY